MKVTSTLLMSIDFEDESYRLSAVEEDTLARHHCDSINRVGILHPPIIKASSPGTYLVVCGRKRLLYARDHLKVSSCVCRIIPATDDPLQAWTVILADMLLERPLTPIEQAEFFNKILADMEIKEAADRFLPMLGLKPQTFLISQLLPLTKLEEPMKIALQNGSLDVKAALQLAPMSFRDGLAIFDMIDHLRLSVGNQRKFINAIKELEKRTGKSILTLLTGVGIQEILNSEANTPQKTDHLLKYLAGQLTPQLSEAKADFRGFANSLKLPENMGISHSQSFESDTVTLTLTFADRQRFRHFWERHRQALVASS